MFTVIVPRDEDRRARAVTRLFETRDGTIWVGTYKGLFQLVITNSGFEFVPVEIGMSSAQVTDLQSATLPLENPLINL